MSVLSAKGRILSIHRRNLQLSIIRTPRYLSKAIALRSALRRRQLSTWFQSFEDPIETWGEVHKEQKRLTVRELLQLANRERNHIAFALGCQLVTSTVTMLFPMVFGRLVDGLQTENAEETLIYITRGLGGIMAAAALATAARVSTMGIVGERMAKYLRRSLYRSILRQEIEFFNQGKSGELVNRLSADVTAVSKFLTDNLTRMVRSTVTSTTGVCALLYLSPKLAAVCVLVLPFAALTSSALGRQVRQLSETVQDKYAATTQTANEKITALRTVRLFGAEERELDLYSNRVEESYTVAKKLAQVEGIYTGANFLVANLTLATVLYVGGSMVISSEISIGTLTSVCMYMVNLGFGVSNLANAYGQLLRAQGCGARVYELINRQPLSTTSTLLEKGMEKGLLPERTTESAPVIRFENVSFAYIPSKRLFEDTTFDLHPGEIVVITGPSGCGKSTLLSLASRLYDPNNGNVLVSGVDVKKWNRKFLRHEVGVVAQDVTLFEGTVAENIMYAADDLSREGVEAVASKAGADKFIEALPQSYDTWVGEKGATLSGGQKKLIGLCRALARHPRLLVLDEALTGLDSATESRVAEAIRKVASSGVGILMIAHGSGPSFNIADRVLTMDGGRIRGS